MENLDVYLEEYYGNSGAKIKSMVNKEIQSFHLPNMYNDYFYSLGSEAFMNASETFDGTGHFHGYFQTCLRRKLLTGLEWLTRNKRDIRVDTVRLDAEYGDEEGRMDKGEVIPSKFDIDKEVGIEQEYQNKKIWKYLESLAVDVREVAVLIYKGGKRETICRKLGINSKEYYRRLDEMKKFRVASILTKQDLTDNYPDEGELAMEDYSERMYTGEISKPILFTVDSWIRKIDGSRILVDHPLQRHSDQWTKEVQGTYITTILHNYLIPPVIIAEQIRPDGQIHNWLIDGLQRLSVCWAFRNNEFAISKKAERPIVGYRILLRDEKGQLIKDSMGSPKFREESLDVRGLRYRDLPTELQERFNDYSIRADQYLGCTPEDIEYHIRRYNNARPMSVSQKGVTHLGEGYARKVKELTKNKFFTEGKGDYTVKEVSDTRGTLSRVITESIMAINFLPDWKSRNEDICTYLKENAKLPQFSKFESGLDRLFEVLTEKHKKFFTSKNSFIWFAAFDKFLRLGLDDARFGDFLNAFEETLHSSPVDGISWDELEEAKNTKDKKTVLGKIGHLEKLIYEYFGFHHEEEEKLENFDVTDEQKVFVERFNDSEIMRLLNVRPEFEREKRAVQSLMMVTNEPEFEDLDVQGYLTNRFPSEEIQEDTLMYLEILNSWSLNVDGNLPIFDEVYIPSLVGIVKYACDNDIDVEGEHWFVTFADNHEVQKKFSPNIKANYDLMKRELDRYIEYVRNRRNVS